MPLPPGTQVGVFTTVGLIGVGGMGEVYEARDTRLGRAVALKILPESVAFNLDRIARFEREAKLLSSIDHPNIASLYGFEDYAGGRVLVMELVSGDDLAARIGRGPLAVDDALAIARQIAAALEAAHDRGIIHRDLKPANVKIRADGQVKVLDFGLAKEMPSSDGLSATPTVLGHTQLDVIVGTAAYMAPEQAQGKTVDKRADIWAFGVVLYEMLTGTSPFLGDSLAGTLAAVLTRELDFAAIPAAARPLVRHCLVRNPTQRLRDIGDAASLLDAAVSPVPVPTTRPGRRLPWVVTALAVVVAAAMSLTLWRRVPDRDARSRRFGVATELANPGNGFALSHDGARFVYSGRADAEQRLWVQDLIAGDARPIVGTEGGKRPFFSPNGEWIAFFTGQARLGHLKKVPTDGNAFNTRGSATTLCDNANLYGGSWNRDTIVFSGPSGLMRVNASGGPCEAISQVDPQEGDHRWPDILPDGKHILFTIGQEGAFDNGRIAVLDMETHRYRTVFDGGAHATYLPGGHLVFVRAGQLFSIAFDPARLAVSGSPRVVVDPIFHVNAGGFAAYSYDDSGTLLYMTPRVDGFEWRDRQGTTHAAVTPPGLFRYFRLSPDGRRVALQQTGRGDIEIADLERGTSQRITSEGMNHTPIWTIDGRAITYTTLGKGLFQRAVDGTAAPSTLIATVGDLAAWDWTSDGQTLLYEQGDPLSIWTFAPARGGERRLLLGDGHTSYQHPAISPDRHWIAYVSTESGSRQISVRSFPDLGRRVTISTAGGEAPRWSPDGTEVLYLSPLDQIMVVEARGTSAGFTASPPRMLLAAAGAFDVDPSGTRFLVKVQKQTERLVLVTNWFTDIERRSK